VCCVDGSMKITPSVPSGAYPMANVMNALVMVGRILSFVHSCKKLRTPVHSGKILFVRLYRLFVVDTNCSMATSLRRGYRLFVRS
jgi:hypothetical protein